MSCRTPYQFARNVHAWGGALLAIVLILVSVTGTALVWKREYLWLTIPQVRGEFELAPAEAAEIHHAAWSNFGAQNVLLTAFNHQNLRLHKVFLRDSRYAYLSSEGKLLAEWQAGERFEELLYDFHHRLLLDTPGLWIVGFSAMFMLVLVPFGVVAWWPSRKAFRPRLWMRGAWQARREMRMTHRNMGVVLCLPLACVLASGVILVFPQQAQEVLLGSSMSRATSLQDAESITSEPQDATTARQEYRPKELADATHAIAVAQTHFDGSRIRSVSVSPQDDGVFTIGLQRLDEFHQNGWNNVTVDGATGQIIKRLDSADLDAIEKLYKLMLPLHTGRVGNIGYRMALSLVGCGIMLLAGLGLRSFLRSFRKA
ncbi:MAG: PepSY-associated TM helix domain-containing protein [Pseudomonadales bacterium]